MPVFGSAQALPSASFGHITPIFLLVVKLSHMAMNTAAADSEPQKEWYVHLKGFSGSPPRPKK